MDLTDRLRQWGAAHAQARSAERAAARHADAPAEQRSAEARKLRQEADRLHSEIYRSLGLPDSARKAGR